MWGRALGGCQSLLPMEPTMETMDELMLDFLQDIYFAEKLGVRGMAKMIRAAESQELKDAITEHRTQSQSQIERLTHVFEALGKRPKTKVCAAMEGLTEEADEAIKESKKGAVLDAALIACAQAVEHYEIARYGALIAWARTAGKDEAADILAEILEEEKASDQLLSEIAERTLNPQALAEGKEHEEEEEEALAPKRRVARAKK